MYGINFNGKHSYDDYDLFVISKSIQPPSKKKIKVDVPFMNGIYDFSTIGSNGEIIYNQREITVKFGISANSKSQLYVKYSRVLEWLQDTGKQKLIFDDIKDYYFMAEVETVPTFQQIIMFGELEIKFIAEPFRTSIDYVGEDIWDTFNFEEDITQDTEFDVVDTKTVNIFNAGRLVMPIINCSTNLSIIFNTKTYNLVSGDNKIYDLKLDNGNNSITVNGTGHIKFIFKKVRI